MDEQLVIGHAPARATREPDLADEVPTSRSGSDRRRTGLLLGGLFLVTAALGLFFARNAPDSYDAKIMLQVTEGIAHRHSVTVQVDMFGWNKPYSSYGLGMSLLMLIPYTIAEALGRAPVPAAMIVDGVIYAIIVVLAAVFALRAGRSRAQALLVAGCVAFGTFLLPFTATEFSEPTVGLGILLCLLGMQGLGRPSASAAGLLRRSRPAALLGFGAGLTVIMRTDSLLLVLPAVTVAGLLLSRRRGADLLAAFAGILPWFALWGAYNAVRFGVPWSTGYSGEQVFSHSLVSGTVDLLISPGRGLFVYAPLVLVALVVLVVDLRPGASATVGRLERWRPAVLPALVLVLLVVRLAFYSRYWAWDGGWGWGPRFLLPVMPALVVGFDGLVRRITRPAWQVPVLLVALLGSLVIQVLGAVVDYRADSLTRVGFRNVPMSGDAISLLPATMARGDRAVENWSLFPVVDHARLLDERRALSAAALNPSVDLRRVVPLAGAGALGVVLVIVGVTGGGGRRRRVAGRVPAAAHGTTDTP